MSKDWKNLETVARLGEWTFRTRPELAGKIEEIARELLSAPLAGRAEKVKTTGGRRAIWLLPMSITAPGRAFIKHYSRPRFIKRLKHLFRNSRTRQEWEMGLKMESLGLPAPRHLAMIERSRRGLIEEDYLVQEALEGHVNFDDWYRDNMEPLRSGSPLAARRAAVRNLAALVRRMHDAGVLQRDFKPDSIMVGGDGAYKLVDLERALAARRLSLDIRLDNLAKIDQTFGFVGSTTDRLRFLRHYFGDELPENTLRRAAARIARDAELKFRKRARERRAWVTESNATYARRGFGDYDVVHHRTLTATDVETVIGRIERGDLSPVPYPGQPGLMLALTWCDALTAMAHTPSLYYRKVPFIPARAAIRLRREAFGVLVHILPGLPLLPWRKAAGQARQGGAEMEFAAALGRSLRVFHRMGMTYPELSEDCLYYDPEKPDPFLRFYLNRLDLLALDRSPGKKEARRILDRTAEFIGLGGDARLEMIAAYVRSRIRWFRAPDRW